MMLSRREFVWTAAGGVLLPSTVLARGRVRAEPLDLLILGGTGFIGPHQVAYAVQRGHRVTVFNRGRRQSGLPASVEHLQGDRNDDLDSLRGRRWDVVIDNSASHPRWVRDSASLLSDAAARYIFISTLSVYASNDQPGADETAALSPYRGADAMAEPEVSGGLYGPLKALSEAEAERAFPGRTLIIRPGLIVGPGDHTDRFSYWPLRVARGGEILAPGTPSDPVQVIDARDLSEWTIRMAEARATGIYNATGPATEMTMGEMLSRIGRGVGQTPNVTFVDAAFLQSHEVRPWSDMPSWIPPVGATAGFMRRSIRRALDAGLTHRPLEETARDTVAWHRTLGPERQTRLAAGITAEREAELLRAWHARG